MSCRVYENFTSAIEGTNGVDVEHKNTGTGRFIVGRDGYEGGREVWECSMDLARYIETKAYRLFQDVQVLRVLELGCGSARPAVTLARARARSGLLTRLFLQEKDEESLNFARQSVFEQITDAESDRILFNFFCDEWSSMTGPIEPRHKFHCVLMSETLYRKEVFDDVTNVLRNVLKPGAEGLCFSAQKRFYFGVGGGSLPYREYLLANKALQASVVKNFEGDGGCVRDITAIRLA